MGAVSTLSMDVRTARRNAMQRESERLDNDAGRAFRIYLAARQESRPAAEIAVLKAAYEAAARNWSQRANQRQRRNVSERGGRLDRGDLIGEDFDATGVDL